MGMTEPPRDVSTVRQGLQSELDRLLEQLRTMKEMTRKTRQAEGNRPGFGKRIDDYSSEALEAFSNRSVARSIDRSIEEIRRALQKIDENSYGLCDVCGRPIDPERLEALPSANQCIECKRRGEQRRI